MPCLLQVGQKTKSADRIIGCHFFSPAHIMPLLEIVRTEETSKQARVCSSQTYNSSFFGKHWATPAAALH